MNKDKIKKLVLDILFKYQGIVVLLILLDQITKIIALNYFYIDKTNFIKEWRGLNCYIISTTRWG